MYPVIPKRYKRTYKRKSNPSTTTPSYKRRFDSQFYLKLAFYNILRFRNINAKKIEFL